MTQLFLLQLSDGTTTVDFMGSTVQVLDGGLEISTTKPRRQISRVRNSVYRFTDMEYEYRDATIRFNVMGATRGAILTTLQTIERILRSVSSSVRVRSNNKGQIAYAWEGSDNTTYFEILAGSLVLPGDVLSVEKILTEVDGQLVLREAQVNLILSPLGYASSIWTPPTKLAITNNNTGTEPTGSYAAVGAGLASGVTESWIEISGDDVEGTGPGMLTWMMSVPASVDIQAIYMGLLHDNAVGFPEEANLLLDSAACLTSWGLTGGAEYYDSSCFGGGYRKVVETGAVLPPSTPQLYWTLSPNYYPWALRLYPGVHYVFLHTRDAYAVTHGYSMGIYSESFASILYQEDFVTPSAIGRMLPLGPLQWPMTESLYTEEYGTRVIDEDNRLGLSYVIDDDSGSTITVDALTTIPITDGLRVVYTNGEGAYGSNGGAIVDDDWVGKTYRIYTPLQNIGTRPYATLDSLKLAPGVDQRVYFKFLTHESALYSNQAVVTVSCRYKPTYITMAL